MSDHFQIKTLFWMEKWKYKVTGTYKSEIRTVVYRMKITNDLSLPSLTETRTSVSLTPFDLYKLHAIMIMIPNIARLLLPCVSVIHVNSI
jgi:hypothetical protein